MFRLKATLVTTTLMRPWRTGWSVDRGVDFSITAPMRPATAPPAARATAAVEPASFIDEDWAAPPDVAVAHSVSGLAEAEAVLGSALKDAPLPLGLRTWWSLASKSSRT